MLSDNMRQREREGDQRRWHPNLITMATREDHCRPAKALVCGAAAVSQGGGADLQM